MLLFFKGYETDRFVPYDRYAKRLIRPIYSRLLSRPAVTGFTVWHRLLVKALQRAGYRVEVNNYKLARAHPGYPVGIVGYPHILNGWNLPNPAILGPAMFDHPAMAPHLMTDSRFKKYIVTCDWMYDLFAPVYGPACVRWFAGIDTDEWRDTQGCEKDVDVLIYDKIRWDYNRYWHELLVPIMRRLDSLGLRHETIRYGRYNYNQYKELLSRSRTLIFLCEHETQGMAYQEALASNLPVLAWDIGSWQDPASKRLSRTPIPTTSVPYFSAECGERFAIPQEFDATFDRFWQRRDRYTPRAFVQRELPLSKSAATYAEHYFS